MRPTALCLIILGSGLLTAQHRSSLSIRSISIEFIPTSPVAVVPIQFKEIMAAWKNKRVNLEVENRLDLASIDRAKEVIREMYGSNGHPVRVEHRVNQVPPGGVEVAFQVVDLCTCE